MKFSDVTTKIKSTYVTRNIYLSLYGLFWKMHTKKALKESNLKLPNVDFLNVMSPEPTLKNLGTQLCTINQCLSEPYFHWCKEMAYPPRLSRKQWEFVYILQCLWENNKIVKGSEGLGFGCGNEPIPSVLAKYGCKILATDLPSSESEAAGWIEGQQHAGSLTSLWNSGICDKKSFNDNVSFRPVNMNDIPKDIGTFDFIWSACALEHLGSLKHGIDFIENTLQYLKPNGISVHTTEFNLSSNEDTFESKHCSIYRKKDIESMIEKFRSLGYDVGVINFNAGSHLVDNHVDFPPYAESPHLKLELEGYICTSIGIYIRNNQ